jgi:sulfite reductase beta subunit-like hemoprotein
MTTVLESRKKKPSRTVVEEYDVAADAKRRISLRHAKTKYFRVRSLSDGSFLLEPRVLVPPGAISSRVLKMLDQSAENLKKGVASPPVDLTPFQGVSGK